MIKLILIFIFLIVSVASATDRPVTCSGNISSALSSAINSAVEGDTVTISSGTCSMSSTVSWTDKNIKIQGAGIGNTNITNSTGGAMFLGYLNTKPVRITGFTINNASGAQGWIHFQQTCNNSGTCTPQYVPGFRIDHIRFNQTGTGGSAYAMLFDGRFSGVIDNCYFYHNTSQFLIGMRHRAMHGLSDINGLTLMWGDHAWTEPADMETINAIYMEDNTYEKVGSGYSTICDASEGSKVTIRYNTFIGTSLGVQFHGTGDSGRGTIYSNVYNNTWTTNQGGGNIGVVLAGTGVVANNTFNGSAEFAIGEHRAAGTYGPYPACNGNYSHDGNAENSGWPCLDQIGRGPGSSPNNNISEPFYFWNNGAMTIANIELANQATYLKKVGDTPAAHTGGVVDYVVGTAKPGWKPYAYPHPLRQEGNTPIPSPKNLHIL
jgi:hypothetical protein